jgi:predicted anti-sigma-YlaC factor YlaD
MLSARLDGRLIGVVGDALDDHLAACSACRGERDALLSVDELLEAAPMAAAPDRLRIRVLARLEHRERARQTLVGGVALAVGTIALALLTVAPMLLGLTTVGSLLPVWEGGGRDALELVVSLVGTAARTGAVLLRAFALPVTAVAICVMFFAVMANGLWIGALYRLRVAR